VVGVVAESLDVEGCRAAGRVTFTLVLRLTPIIAILYWSPLVSAQQDLSRWEDLFSQHPSEFRVRYGITPYFEEPVRGQATEFSLVQQDFWTSAEVWRDGNNQVWVHGGLRYQDIHTEAILPDTSQPFPEHLWNVIGGATYRHLFDEGSMIGGSLSIGSASDQPFHSSRELVGSLTAFYRLALEGRDSWLFFLSYNNNRDYANSVPIPGIEYLYNPSREFHAMVGFPMESLDWKPTEDLAFRLSYSIIHNIHALIAYRLAEPVQLYTGFDWNTQSYLLVNRPDSKDRFYYDEKRVKSGVKLTLIHGLVLDLSGGYAFDRSYRESPRHLRDAFDRVDIASGLYALASIDFSLGGSREPGEAGPKRQGDH